MADRYCTPSGWSVEVVQLTGTPDHHDGTWLRVTYFGSYVADVRTPGELACYFPLADLEPRTLTGRMLSASCSYPVLRAFAQPHLDLERVTHTAVRRRPGWGPQTVHEDCRLRLTTPHDDQLGDGYIRTWQKMTA